MRRSLLTIALLFLAVSTVYSQNLLQVAEDAGLTTLVDLVYSVDLQYALNGTGPFTVFAPTNQAFAALPSAPSGTALNDTLKYHALAGDIRSNNLQDNTRAETIEGSYIIVNVKGANAYVNGIQVATADVEASNGVAHVVGKVLSIPAGNIVEIGSATPRFSTLVSLVTAANLGGALSAAGPLTVFAPNNDAFAAVPAHILEYLGTNVTALTEVLTYHVLPQAVFSSFISAGSVTTVEGQTVEITTAGGVTVGGASVINADINADNGVIHEINAVLLPPGIYLPAAPSTTPSAPPSSASTATISMALLLSAFAMLALLL
jgi:transforming growth factor-beta-induced protein